MRSHTGILYRAARNCDGLEHPNHRLITRHFNDRRQISPPVIRPFTRLSLICLNGRLKKFLQCSFGFRWAFFHQPVSGIGKFYCRYIIGDYFRLNFNRIAHRFIARNDQNRHRQFIAANLRLSSRILFVKCFEVFKCRPHRTFLRVRFGVSLTFGFGKRFWICRKCLPEML